MKTLRMPGLRTALVGLLAMAILGLLGTFGPANFGVSLAQEVYAPAAAAPAGATYQVVAQPGGVTQVFLFDPATQRLCVYHVDPNKGEIALKSVRNVSFDMQMMQFNSDNPSPQDVRSGLSPQ